MKTFVDTVTDDDAVRIDVDAGAAELRLRMLMSTGCDRDVCAVIHGLANAQCVITIPSIGTASAAIYWVNESGMCTDSAVVDVDHIANFANSLCIFGAAGRFVMLMAADGDDSDE